MIHEKRRKRFIKQVENGIAIFRNSTADDEKYHPDMDFYYLTGFDEPNAVCATTSYFPDADLEYKFAEKKIAELSS